MEVLSLRREVEELMEAGQAARAAGRLEVELPDFPLKVAALASLTLRRFPSFDNLRL